MNAALGSALLVCNKNCITVDPTYLSICNRSRVIVAITINVLVCAHSVLFCDHVLATVSAECTAKTETEPIFNFGVLRPLSIRVFAVVIANAGVNRPERNDCRVIKVG